MPEELTAHFELPEEISGNTRGTNGMSSTVTRMSLRLWTHGERYRWKLTGED